MSAKRKCVARSVPAAPPGADHMLLLDTTESYEPTVYLVDLVKAPPPARLMRILRKMRGDAACYVKPTAIVELQDLLDYEDGEDKDEEGEEDEEEEDDDGEDIRAWFGDTMIEANVYSNAFQPGRPLPAYILSLAEGWW